MRIKRLFIFLALLSCMHFFTNCKDKAQGSQTNRNEASKVHEHHGTEHNHETEDESETVELDEQPIYSIGDKFLPITGRSLKNKKVSFPSNNPTKKLLAFIEPVPENDENYNEHQIVIKSLDTFAINNPTYEIVTIHFGDYDIKLHQNFLQQIKSKLRTDILIKSSSYYDSLDVNVGPMYFKLDKDNRLEKIFVAHTYSHEF